MTTLKAILSMMPTDARLQFTFNSQVKKAADWKNLADLHTDAIYELRADGHIYVVGHQQPFMKVLG